MEKERKIFLIPSVVISFTTKKKKKISSILISSIQISLTTMKKRHSWSPHGEKKKKHTFYHLTKSNLTKGIHSILISFTIIKTNLKQNRPRYEKESITLPWRKKDILDSVVFGESVAGTNDRVYLHARERAKDLLEQRSSHIARRSCKEKLAIRVPVAQSHAR